VVAVIEKLDGVWPVGFGEGIETTDVSGPLSVSEETEHGRNLQRIIELTLLDIRLTEDSKGRAILGDEKTFHGGESGGLVLSDELALNVARGSELKHSSNYADEHTYANETFSVEQFALGEHVEGSYGGHDETAGLHGTEHVVSVLREGPGIEDQTPEAGESNFAAGEDTVAGGMLHPGVSGNDQVSGKPRTDENQDRRDPMTDAAKSFFAIEEETKKTGLQEEGKNAFHGECLANDTAGSLRKLGPICAELKFHGDAGDDAEGEVNPEDFGPEASSAVVVLVAGAEEHSFKDDNQKGKAHGQLRKKIVESHREGEMEAVNIQSGSHADTSGNIAKNPSSRRQTLAGSDLQGANGTIFPSLGQLVNEIFNENGNWRISTCCEKRRG